MRFIIIFVAGLSVALFADFSRNAALEIVTDTKTKLQWQDNKDVVSQTKTWTEAITYCENLMLDGGAWRLPNANELYDLADKSKIAPAIGSEFKSTNSANYWSSTTHTTKKEKAWNVYFYNGQNNAKDKNEISNIRCVRTGL